jgi:hypothetical protein
MGVRPSWRGQAGESVTLVVQNMNCLIVEMKEKGKGNFEKK